MKLLITGGHLAPALACIDALKDKGTDIIFVGRKYSNEREKTLTLEYQEIQKRSIPFHHLTAGRFTRFLSIPNLLNLLLIPVGFFNAYRLLSQIQPDKVLSFGGYLALPVAVVAHLKGIKVYTHDQTIHPGITNRIIARFATKIFVSFTDSKKYFVGKEVIVSGNPVRKDVFESGTLAFDLPKGTPVIYITGGSLGSHSINEHIRMVLPQLVSRYVLIHQTGNVAEYGDFEKLQQARSQLSPELQKNYILKQHVQANEIGAIYKAATLVLSRAGANTFFELVALKKPAILIPLPWSAHDEQQQQAALLKSAGVAEIFNQSGSSEELLALIAKMIQNIEAYQKNFSSLSSLYRQNATETIISEILAD